MRHVLRIWVTMGVAVAGLLLWAGAGQAEADRAKLEAFMEVTGFDIALDSLRMSAGSAPIMLGLEEADFGTDWTRLADRVFETGQMRNDALDILEQTLDDEMLGHAAAFYASDLGQRLVAAENASHMVEDDVKSAQGAKLVAQLVSDGSPRLALFTQMSAAIGSTESGLRAMTEIQVRFLMAAMAAGLVDSQMEEEDLRGALASQAPQIRLAMRENALTGNAYTYRDFSDEDVAAYLAALEEPLMKKVYELMSAVQFTIMADRFQRLAVQMADLHPQQDI